MFIVLAIRWTILLSAVAMVGGGVLGIVLALARTMDSSIARWLSGSFILFFQGTPLLLQLFLAFFGLSLIGVDLGAYGAAALALTLHAAAFLGEIWRGSIEALPKGQWEASRALGLSYVTTMRSVIAPQAMRLAMAPTVGFVVQLIKGTSLAAIIGFVEVTRAGQIVNNATFEPFAVFGLVSTIYFLLCWPLSLLGGRLERGLSR